MAAIVGHGGRIEPGSLHPQPAAEDSRRVAAAGQQFEALLIGQMLKSVQESDDGGWTGTGSDDAGAPAMELAAEQLAQSMASRGGLGLARLVIEGLHAKTGEASTGSQKLQP